MSEKDKKILDAFGRAIAVLPDEKKDYFLGYADGVMDVKGKPTIEEGAERRSETGCYGP